MPADAPERLVAALAEQFGARVVATEAVRRHHAADEGGMPPALP
jgi:hypothetical protein